ncbi:hypothetical protein [Hymenobacter terricola]|uniref:hypothetical protein n=1 Tax=Hymenobacter terricola TaxID=2819236 RepID=UPI001B30E872|nr:hypothetical protein [Hymenobacter terricola]
MRFIPLLPAAVALLFTAACSQAQSDKASDSPTASDMPKGGDRRKDKDAAAAIPGLRKVGSLKDVVPESSGLAPANAGQSYFSFGDDGNAPTLYEISGAGKLVRTLEVPAANTDWESLSRDGQGNYYIGDCGNNESIRRDLKLFKFRPDAPTTVGTIAFKYPDQTEFPPKKKQRNFDCEASLWHDGQVWLFTKDRGQDRTSKVYTVPDQPGTYTAKLVTSLAIPGEVTDAALRADGHRLVLLGRGELFILDGNSWAEILKATPREISLAGAGQTEGAVFKDDQTLLISTEQGALYEFKLP